MKFSDIASAPTQGKVSSIQVQPAKHGALFAVGSWGTGNTSSINIRSIDTSSPQGGFDAYSTSNNMNSALSSAERISEKLASYSMKGDVTDISWCRGVLFSSSSLGSLHMLQMSQGMNKQQQSISLDQAHEFSNIHSGSITSVAVQV